MSIITKPMTADKAKLDKLNYPVIGTPKLDGIRCLKIDGEIVSRKFKLIPNLFIRKTLGELLPNNMDGEIIVGDNFQNVSSGVMTQKGEPDFVYHVFDYVKNDLNKPYLDRLTDLREALTEISSKRVHYVQETMLATEAELLTYEDKCLTAGYEGIMLRSPDSPYKCGRSTLKQGWLLKLKQFIDSEAEILGFVELMHNENELQKDELGHAKRSSAKDGKVPAGTLGKFEVRDLTSGVMFNIGTGKGLTHKLRQEIWDDRDSYLGHIVKYKYQPHGVKDKPRSPIWLGFRHPDDMG